MIQGNYVKIPAEVCRVLLKYTNWTAEESGVIDWDDWQTLCQARTMMAVCVNQAERAEIAREAKGKK